MLTLKNRTRCFFVNGDMISTSICFYMASLIQRCAGTIKHLYLYAILYFQHVSSKKIFFRCCLIFFQCQSYYNLLQLYEHFNDKRWEQRDNMHISPYNCSDFFGH